MTSHAPRKCCTVGVKHEGTASGTKQTIGDIPTYFAYPENKSTEHAVLFLTDIFGLDYINNQLIADQFAANGYFTVMPDILHGDVPDFSSGGFDIQKWLKGPPGHMPDRIDPVITQVIKEMREKHGVKKIGVVGYCFGAKYVVRFTGATGKQNGASCDAGFVAHPSLVEADELKTITAPLSIAAAEVDHVFPPEKRHESETILADLLKNDAAFNYQVSLYGGVSHGFAVRADLSNQRQKLAKEQAFYQAVGWFDHFIKGIA